MDSLAGSLEAPYPADLEFAGAIVTLDQTGTVRMKALDPDMADWWEPAPENYLVHVSKERILAVVAEAAASGNADACLMRG